jgi:hypothetical protein
MIEKTIIVHLNMRKKDEEMLWSNRLYVDQKLTTAMAGEAII